LLAKVGQSGHSVADAVAELVDNAIDARVGRKIKVAIRYDARRGWIEIRDNGMGMTRTQLSDALVLGLSEKGEGKIGRFGLGLKTACTSLGSRFEIRTSPKSGKVEWVAEYDEKEFLRQGNWRLPIRRRNKSQSRGTAILIHSSRIYPALSQSLERNLGSIFRHFIEDEILDLTLNGERIEAMHQEIDRTSVLPLEGEVLGLKVRGWVGLLLVSSQRGWYGFSLVRNRRVIRRHEKLGFRGHPSTARVVGELHLDRFPVNNLKTDFIRETDEWHALERWVSKQIEPVLAMSRALAHAGTFDSSVKEKLEAERERILADLLPAEAVPLPVSATPSALDSTPVNVVLGTTHMTHRFEPSGHEEPHLRVEYLARVDEPDVISVFTNVDHVAMTTTDPSLIACQNLADAASLALGEKSEFLSLKSQLLEILLEQDVVRRALRNSFEPPKHLAPVVEPAALTG
jgi:anti-sigma regulatory factor (Ser/Thr protein kinase)